MIRPIALKARCERCGADLEVRGGHIVGEVIVFVVPLCKCREVSPRRERLDGRAGAAAPAQKTR